MTELVWDQVGQRFYEMGLDRGVLYVPDQPGVVWNGLLSVGEDFNRESKEFFLDGIKYLEHQVLSHFSGKLQALTYPDAFEALIGVASYAPGVFLHDQPVSTFGLSYRTLIGNDVDAIDHGYKLHLLYNLLAIPSGTQFDTLSGSSVPVPFEWTISATPPTMFGARPTAHLSIHSREIDPDLLAEIEAILYGSVGVEPTLPSIVDFLAMVDP